jgi:hypothetical protein
MGDAAEPMVQAWPGHSQNDTKQASKDERGQF